MRYLSFSLAFLFSIGILYGQRHNNEGLYTESIKAFEEMRFQDAKQGFEQLAQQNKLSPEGQFYQAINLISIGQLHTAKPLIDQLPAASNSKFVLLEFLVHASYLQKLGRPDKADSVLTSYAKWKEQYEGEYPELELMAAMLLLENEVQMGRTLDVIPTLEKALQQAESIYGSGDIRVAPLMTGLGYAYTEDGRNNRADSLLRQSTALLDRGPAGNPHHAMAYLNLGFCLIHEIEREVFYDEGYLGNYTKETLAMFDELEMIFSKSLTIAEASNDTLLQSLIMVSLAQNQLLFVKKDPKQGAFYFHRMLQLLSKSEEYSMAYTEGSSIYEFTQKSIAGIANLIRAQGYQGADKTFYLDAGIARFQQSLDIGNTIWKGKHLLLGRLNEIWAGAHSTRGSSVIDPYLQTFKLEDSESLKKAIEGFDRSIEAFMVNGKIINHTALATTLIMKGNSLEILAQDSTMKQEAYEEMLASSRAAMQVVDEQILTNTNLEYWVYNLHYTQKMNSNAVSAGLALYQFSGEERYLNSSFEAMEKSKSNRLLFSVRNKSIKAGGKEKAANLNPITIKAVQSKLLDDQLLIEYFTYGKPYVCAITHEAYIILPIENSLTDNSTFKDFLSATINSHHLTKKDFVTFTESSFAIYREWLKPILETFPDKKKLIIIPDGSLASIPFEILISQLPDTQEVSYGIETMPYLIKDYKIQYGNSATTFFADTPPKPRTSTTYAGFAPTFVDFKEERSKRSTLPSAPLKELNRNKKEVLAGQNAFGGIYFLDTEATLNNFRSASQEARILHLATHAFKDDFQPLEGEIIFSDSVLRVGDLFEMNINADLVVLSACNSAAGKQATGLGNIHFARGFASAGTPNIVAGLWSIDDAQTANIDTAFFKKITQSQPISDALRNAKLDYLAAQEGKMTAPFYWAPLIHIGRDRVINVQGADLPAWAWILLVACCAVLVFAFLRRKS